MPGIGKSLMLLGIVLFVIGLIWTLIGRLPGDIMIKKGTTTFYFPIVTCIVISIVLSLLFSIIGRWR